MKPVSEAAFRAVIETATQIKCAAVCVAACGEPPDRGEAKAMIDDLLGHWRAVRGNRSSKVSPTWDDMRLILIAECEKAIEVLKG